jgi:hypothetical protein
MKANDAFWVHKTRRSITAELSQTPQSQIDVERIEQPLVKDGDKIAASR